MRKQYNNHDHNSVFHQQRVTINMHG